MKISLETFYTPYTLDTYQTFCGDGEEDRIIQDLLDNKEIKNENEVEFTFKHKEYLNDLAINLILLLNQKILDDVILGISSNLEVLSPNFYNFTTDHIFIDFKINKVNLKNFIEKNKEDYEKNKITDVIGFWWFGNKWETMLAYYLHKVSAEKYTKEYYICDQLESVPSYEYINYKIIKK